MNRTTLTSPFCRLCSRITDIARTAARVSRCSTSSFPPPLQEIPADSAETELGRPPNGLSPRFNAVGIQMLSKPLHEHIFGETSEVKQADIERVREHLESRGLWGKTGSTLPDLDVPLPALQGRNVDEHFRLIAEEQLQPYLPLAKLLASSDLPPMPRRWLFEAGWTRYERHSGSSKMFASRVDYPDDDALILDVEVCVTESQRPILATAVSQKYWYSWVSRRLMSGEDYYGDIQRRTVMDDLIPLETREGEMEPDGGNWLPRLVVGHNVGYDRARVKEQYLMKGPKTKFLDTLSLHTCVAGQTTKQKVLWKSKDGFNNVADPRDHGWMGVSAPNSLVDVHWLYVGSKEVGVAGGGASLERISKAQREVFVKGRIQDIRKNFQNLTKYCAEDVRHTHEILQKLLPLFLQRCPHPVTLAGMLEMGGAYLPVDQSWETYLEDAEYTYRDMEWEMKTKLMALADSACRYMKERRYESDPWLCNLDWSTKKFRGKAKTPAAMKRLLRKIEDDYNQRHEAFRAEGSAEGDIEKGEEEKYELLISTEEPALPKRPVHMPGYPEWYRSLCLSRTHKDWQRGCTKISAQTRVTPYLLRMKWKGHPLNHHPKLGWGYIVSPDLKPGEVPSFGEEEESESVQLLVDPVIDSVEQLMYQFDSVVEETDNAVGGEVMLISLNGNGLEDDYHSPVEDGFSLLTEENEDFSNRVKRESSAAEEEKWVPRRLRTCFGVTDDVITLSNGQTFFFFKLPHKYGVDGNCGSPLSKDFLHKIETQTLTSAAGHAGQRIINLNSMMSFWRGARNRIIDQFVVWQGKSGVPTIGNGEFGAIVPVVRVAATTTRRAVEPTWLTASNPKETRIGSELKAMVRAPPGYHLVGADVDSQELWIASVLGDMHFAGMHGCTAIGWMTLQGNKAEGTDVHSKTAATIGISRDHAKILNYGRIYGAGKPFIEQLLKQFNPSLSEHEVEEKAKALFIATKGVRAYILTKDGQKLAEKCGIPYKEDGSIDSQDWWRLKKAAKRSKDDLLHRQWVGGSESQLFNQLEEIANSEFPWTPVLGCHISRALEKAAVSNSYVTSRINWVVQSSAVDYLHLMLVSMRWLMDQYNIDGRFCISIHDEVRYLVRSEDRYRAALALQFTNLFTRAMFAHCLNMNDLPQSVAFFSAVDIDKVLRKEPLMDCTTPSNPYGLELGHNIPYGEALDIYQLLEKTQGSLEQ